MDSEDRFLDADVVEQPDQMGEDNLYFRLHFALGSKVARGPKHVDAQVAVFNLLSARGEKRFPREEPSAARLMQCSMLCAPSVRANARAGAGPISSSEPTARSTMP